MVVEADKHQIEQVLLNIYVNALQAMPGGGDLFLKTQPIAIDEENSQSLQISTGDYVKISLTDNGVGIAEDILDNIFDPFFTTKEKGRGTGLGLASAYGVEVLLLCSANSAMCQVMLRRDDETRRIGFLFLHIIYFPVP